MMAGAAEPGTSAGFLIVKPIVMVLVSTRGMRTSAVARKCLAGKQAGIKRLRHVIWLSAAARFQFSPTPKHVLELRDVLARV